MPHAQPIACVCLPREPQSPHTHRSSADGSSVCATPLLGRRRRGALRRIPPAGPHTSAPQPGVSQGGRGELRLAATLSSLCRAQAMPVCAGPARCSRDRDREVINKPPPPRISTSFSDFRCVGGHAGCQQQQAAGLGAERAAGRQYPSSIRQGTISGRTELRSRFPCKQPP